MKNPVILLTILSLLMSPALLAQVSISTDGTTPHSSAMLEVKSTDRGILVPRLTTAQRTGITGPAEGLLVYDSETDSFWFYSGSAWQELRTDSGSALSDSDNDTKVTVESGSDEDLIRFQLGGAEKMVLRNNSLDLNPGNDNVIVAPFSGTSITSASNNSIFGYSAGQMNATGNYNSFFGSSVGLNNIDGSSNVAMGAYSLLNNTSGSHNVAIGNSALYNNTDRSDLIAVGDSALYYNGTGAVLSFHGTNNTAIGSRSLAMNTTGFRNTATGYFALYSNTEGAGNTAFGTEVLLSNTIGYVNTAIGGWALHNNISGYYNIAVGAEALYSNEDGIDNVGIGTDALANNISGDNNTSLGNYAGFSSIGGDGNIFLGYKAGDNLTTGSNNIVIGNDINVPSSHGSYQMVIGAPDVIYGNLSRKHIGIGTSSPSRQLEITESFEFPTTTNDSTGVIYKGIYRFIHDFHPVSAYGENTFIGINSGNFTMPGSIYDYSCSSYNTAVGYKSLASNTTGHSNTADGNNALSSNTDGNNNSAVGDKALYSNISGYGNTSVGSYSIYNNLTGSCNTAIGYLAGNGSDGISFSNNTLVGFRAGYGLSTGSHNILIGYQAGETLTTGSENILIGYNINAPDATGSHQMVIGNQDLFYGDLVNNRIGIGTTAPQGQLHLESASDVLVILDADSDNAGGEDQNPRLELRQDGEAVEGALGFIGNNGAIYTNSIANALYLVNEFDSPLHFGTADSVVMTILSNAKVGIGTTEPIQRLDVNGNARFRSVGSSAYTSALNLTANGTLTTNTSDIRLKTNVETLTGGLERVMHLRGVEFNWRSDPEGKKMIGFIAQETEPVVPELVFTNPTDGYMGINYAEMTAVLVEAVKEQQKMIGELQKKVEELVEAVK
jgi:hypothetical protein